jgi:hypothetical protein
MIITPEEMKNLAPSDRAMDAYKFAIAYAGMDFEPGSDEEAEFIAKRNAKAEGFRDMAETQKWMEKTAASMKAANKHTWNVGTEDDLPPNVKWSKQSYTYAFEEGQARVIAQSLIDSGLTTKEQLFDSVTVTAMQKAAGITTDKMLELFHDGIEIKPKERALTIK